MLFFSKTITILFFDRLTRYKKYKYLIYRFFEWKWFNKVINYLVIKLLRESEAKKNIFKII